MQGADILLELFIIYALAKVAGEVMTRIGQPPVIGEILVGVAIGEHALGLVHETDVLRAVAEIGVVFLLFEVGLENRFSDLRKVGGTATGVAISGVVVPFAAGFGLLALLGHATNESLFSGAAMVATSVGVTARVLSDLGLLRKRESQVILGAAVIDDVLGLLILAVVSGAAEGNLSAGRIVVLLVEAAFFLVFIATVGTRLMRRHGPLLERLRIADGPYVFAVIICLGLSAFAGRIGLAAIIGAFLAGMVLAEGREQFEIEKRIEPVTNFLTPFFFVLTGMAVNPDTLASGPVAALALTVTVVAVVAKLGPCALAARRMGARSALIVGTGMVPRGEVGIIVASIGLATKTIEADVYGVVVAMSILTTLIVPPALRVLFKPQVGATEPGGVV